MMLLVSEYYLDLCDRMLLQTEVLAYQFIRAVNNPPPSSSWLPGVDVNFPCKKS